MTKRDFLVELGTEELPPKSLLSLAAAFRDGMVAGLDAAGLPHGAAIFYATPRRLAVYVRRLADEQPEQKIQRRGPPVSAAFDANGKPTRAALGFADSCGVNLSKLQRTSESGNEFLYFSGMKPGAMANALLPGIVHTALDRLPVARRMRWGAGEAEFVRPVHWVVMVHGEQLVEGKILGVAAGRTTRGHRFHAPKPIALRSPGGYAVALERRGYVMPDFEARRECIRIGALAAAEGAGGRALIDPAILEEVTALTEWPVPIVGQFDARYLKLPPEVLIATLQDHQRYFPVQGRDGKLRPQFVAIANLESRDPAQVRAGNERVVRPRLADAEFFYAADRARPLEDRRADLAAVTFQAKLGSLADKTARIVELTNEIARVSLAEPVGTQRAAQLAKCDLLTDMVGEFPELQGVMGRYYALADGEPDEVAMAIAEQYLPRFAGDTLPSSGAGLALAIADRLDTLVGIFAIGQKPTGAKDPFGLRRAALGVLRIVIETGMPLDLRGLIATALASVRADLAQNAADTNVPDSVADEVYDFMMERLRAWYLERKDAPTTEMFEAVLDTRPASPLDFDDRLRALAAFLKLPEAASLAAAHKRISNILRKSGEQPVLRVDPALLKEPAERQLATEIEALRKPVESDLASRRYTEALCRLATLRPSVDAFFDRVMVMAEDAAVRANRLALLAALQKLFLHTANLSRLPG